MIASLAILYYTCVVAYFTYVLNDELNWWGNKKNDNDELFDDVKSMY